jgi:predicted transcriptional regulator
MPQTSFTINADLRKRIKKYTDKTGVSMKTVIVLAVDEFLEKRKAQWKTDQK